MLQGIFETHLNVSNLERSMQFYEDVLGLELGLKDEERRAAFYWVGGHNQAMLGLWEKEPAEIFRQHFAFQIALDKMDEAADSLRSKGLQLRNFLNDGTDQPMVFGWMPALAIYFSDPDNHSLEFIAPLPGEPRPEAGVVSWAVWERGSSKKNR